MKIVIMGAGEVGSYLSLLLSTEGHDVTIVERDADTCRRLDDQLDVRVVQGNGGSAATLKNANVDTCDFFLAMASDDQANLIASSLARALGAGFVITRVHDQTYADHSLLNYQVHFGIDVLINPEALSAVELAKSIRNPGRVAVENFARGQIEAQLLQIDKSSRFCGTPLRNLKLPHDVRFGFFRRGEVEDVPTADTILEAGDVVTMFGSPNELIDLRRKLDPGAVDKQSKVVIFGGGETAIALLKLLNSPRFKVRIVEQRLEQCEALAQRFRNVIFIHGDGTSLRLMEEEQIGDADYFVSTTHDDECNIMTAIQAAKLGAKHVEAVINKSDYEEILNNLRDSLGIETIVSPRVVTANEVLRFISRKPYNELFKLPGQSARILEFVVRKGSPACDQKLRDIAWPKFAVVVALQHQYTARVPGANDVIQANDRVAVVTREDNIKALQKLLRG